MERDEVLARKYPMHFHYAEGTWFVSFPDLPGLLTDGETLPLALEHAEEARELYLTTALETGAPIPEPGTSALARLAAPDDGEDAGAATMQRLMPGLAAVLKRLEYGAAKHPDDDWARQTDLHHVVRLYGHVEALKQYRMPENAADVRRHLAAITCRALMTLTVQEQGKRSA